MTKATRGTDPGLPRQSTTTRAVRRSKLSGEGEGWGGGAREEGGKEGEEGGFGGKEGEEGHMV